MEEILGLFFGAVGLAFFLGVATWDALIAYISDIEYDTSDKWINAVAIRGAIVLCLAVGTFILFDRARHLLLLFELQL